MPRSPGSRVLAFVLSLFGAGAGQFYLGHGRRGLIWLAIGGVGLLLGGWMAVGAGKAGIAIGLILMAVGSLARLLSAIDSVLVKPRSDRPKALSVVGVFVLAMGLSVAMPLVVRRFMVEAFKIPSGAMMPALLVGDHIFVNKVSHRARRGHMFVFQFPEHPEQDFVKRAIAVGGDVLEMRNGHPWINGWAVPHCSVGRGTLPPSEPESPASTGELFVEYLEGEAYLTFLDEGYAPPETEGPWTVPHDEAFFLGDNRQNSHDSRKWFGGAGGGVPAAMVRGEPFLIWLSVAPNGALEGARTGQEFSLPVLPSTMASLKPALDACLAKRPPREATVPPAQARASATME
jgi:signal peptidase I